MMRLKLVAVTACVSGVAHTYMAAERLEKICLHEKWSIKIETQGALGIENALNEKDINEADVVLLIADIDILDYGRFDQQKIIHSGVNAFLIDSRKVIDAVKQVMLLPTITKIKVI